MSPGAESVEDRCTVGRVQHVGDARVVSFRRRPNNTLLGTARCLSPLRPHSRAGSLADRRAPVGSGRTGMPFRLQLPCTIPPRSFRAYRGISLCFLPRALLRSTGCRSGCCVVCCYAVDEVGSTDASDGRRVSECGRTPCAPTELAVGGVGGERFLDTARNDMVLGWGRCGEVSGGT